MVDVRMQWTRLETLDEAVIDDVQIDDRGIAEIEVTPRKLRFVGFDEIFEPGRCRERQARDGGQVNVAVDQPRCQVAALTVDDLCFRNRCP
jgi:hypothetical protein